jgi:hypothetical protein
MDRQQLIALGLNPDAPGLAPEIPAEEKTERVKKPRQIKLAPDGVDPHTMPVEDIVFDPRLLDDFPTLKGSERTAASRHLFELYKSRQKGERNQILHRRINEFLSSVAIARKSGTKPVKEKIKATKEQRDMAEMMAQLGLTADDLGKLVQEVAERRANESA